jgi:hypothetical protein
MQVLSVKMLDYVPILQALGDIGRREKFRELFNQLNLSDL